MEIISLDHTRFLQLRQILDNIVLVQETMTWVKTSRQPLLLLNLILPKAHDEVSWNFHSMVMYKLGFGSTIIGMIKILFKGAIAWVSINGEAMQGFSIYKGIRKGCPVAPYLFLFVGEILNLKVQQGVEMGSSRGIKISNDPIQLRVSQYVDDTSLINCGEERYALATMGILD